MLTVSFAKFASFVRGKGCKFAGVWGVPNKQSERTLVRECVSEYPKRIS